MKNPNSRNHNSSYPDMMLSKALQSSNAATRPIKVRQWLQVISGINDGSIIVGSRVPVNAPEWVSLQVITGGFATGGFMAGGSDSPFEIDLKERLKIATRRECNEYFLSDLGYSELLKMLNSGMYQLNTAEEGALLSVAWLTENGQAEQAQLILKEIAPWFDQLRFFPTPTETTVNTSTKVFLDSVQEVIRKLKLVKTPVSILRMKDSIEAWLPIYHAAIELFLETVQGQIPIAQTDANGKIMTQSGKFLINGDYPCQCYPDDWTTRANSVVQQFNDLANNALNVRLTPRRASSVGSLGQLIPLLKKAAQSPKELTGREVGKIRLIMARYLAKRGMPHSEKWLALRSAQDSQCDTPLFSDIATVLRQRLTKFPDSTGLEDIDIVLQNVTLGSSKDPLQVPPHICRKVMRCHSQSIEEHIADGMISSADVLADLVPQLTAHSETKGIKDPSLRALYHSLYATFRRRRSLLLLNLENQIQLAEIPWIHALARHTTSAKKSSLCLDALTQLCKLALQHFPQAILPNKLRLFADC